MRDLRLVVNQEIQAVNLFRDWIDDSDFDLDYKLCECCVCKQSFFGYKQRVICKVCGLNIIDNNI